MASMSRTVGFRRLGDSARPDDRPGRVSDCLGFGEVSIRCSAQTKWCRVVGEVLGGGDRLVTQDSPRKSLSIENTFSENIRDIPALEREMNTMLDELEEDLRTRHTKRQVRSLVVKMKFADFRRTTAERTHPEIDRQIFKALLVEADSRSEGKPARLLGVGVRFHDIDEAEQMELFEQSDGR